MFSKSSWLHLRIPFSYFLLPIFLFSLAISPNISGSSIFWTFLIVHFFLYPASNAFNSYFDRDEKSIGGLKNPPPVRKGLYYLALSFDLIAIILGFVFINPTFAVMLFVYGAVSKAYSHPMIRIKRHAISSWIIAGVFQGVFTFVMCYIGLNDFPLESALKPSVLTGGLLTTLMLWANYPMTQIYQHEEDRKRGDHTLSILLGIRGTFYFVGIVFTLVTAGFMVYFQHYFPIKYAYIFLFALAPIVMYFIYWFFNVRKDESKADFTHTMWLNFISATCLNVFFVYFFLDWTNILQAFR